MKINNVVVIGSGTMGSGIAAQLCNANIPVTLLDLKTEISQKAKERIEKSRPPLLIDKSKIDGIKVGNISDDFNIVSEADWIAPGRGRFNHKFPRRSGSITAELSDSPRPSASARLSRVWCASLNGVAAPISSASCRMSRTSLRCWPSPTPASVR